MSISVSMSSEAIAAQMASSLGFTEMDVADISRMLELKHSLLPVFQVSVAFLVLAWFAVSLRVYARAFVLRSLHWDDWLMLLTLCVFTACCSCLIAIESIERSDAARRALSNGLKAQFGLIDTLFGVSYMKKSDTHGHMLTGSLAHLGVYVSLHRHDSCTQARSCHLLSPHHTRKLLLATKSYIRRDWDLHNLWPGFHIYCCLPVWQSCQLLSARSQESMHVGHNITALVSIFNFRHHFDQTNCDRYYAAGGMNALTDWIFSLLPVTVIWSAAIPRSTKISAGCLLGLGSLASIASLIRLAFIPGIQASPTFLQNASSIACWSIVEPGLGIIAASLAALRPLFRHCFPGKQHVILPTTHRGGKPITSPGTFVSRMSFEDTINPYGIQLGCVTTIVGNADETELRTIDRKAKKPLSSIHETSRHSRAASAMSDVSRVDSGPKMERRSSLRSLMRHERHQLPPPAIKQAHIQNGRVVMSRNVTIEQELSVSHSHPSSPV
jgi:hypothetical protein